MSVLLKVCCDGSGSTSDPNAKYLTLAGYIGTFDAWAEFERRWDKVLRRWGCSYLHMVDAWSFRGEFSGWTEKQVKAFLGDLFNKCFTPIGRGKKYKGKFYGISCTVNLNDYRNVAKERGVSLRQNPEALCVHTILKAALMGLPDNPDKPSGKDGSLELYFDNNEPFLHEIEKLRKDIPREQLAIHPLGLISSMGKYDMRRVIGIQAADYLAWQTNRYHASNPQHDLGFADSKTVIAAISRVLATEGYSEYYDYKRLKQL